MRGRTMAVTTVKFDMSPEEVAYALRLVSRNPLAPLARRAIAATAARSAERLSGPTEIELSEAGIRRTAEGGSRQIAWAQVAWVNERPLAWVFTLTPPENIIIPKTAVSADGQALF